MNTLHNKRNIGRDILIWIYCLFFITVLLGFDVVWSSDSYIYLGAPREVMAGVVILVLISWPIRIFFTRWVVRLNFNRSRIIRILLFSMNTLIILNMISFFSTIEEPPLWPWHLKFQSSELDVVLTVTNYMIAFFVPIFIGFCALIRQERTLDFCKIEWVFFWISLLNGIYLWRVAADTTLMYILILLNFNVFGR